MKSLAVIFSSLAIITTSYAQTNFWQNSGNIGIGTTSPGEKLDINGNIMFHDQTFYLSGDRYKYLSTTNQTGDFITLAANPYSLGIQFGFSTPGSPGIFNPKVTLLPSGNVGIGTSTPFSKLDIADAFGSGVLGTTGGQVTFSGPWYSGAPANLQRMGAIRGYKTGGDGSFGGGLQFMYQPNASGGNPVVGAVLDGSGSVGIGTISPASKLHVGGSTSETISIGSFSYDSSKALAGLKAGEYPAGEKRGTLEFQTLHWNGDPYALTTDMAISNGRVGIGTTNPGNNKLQVFGAVGTNDYTLTAQHSMQFRIVNGLGAQGSRALELGLLDNGTSIIQSNECGVGYNTLALNPVAGNVGIGTTSPSEKLSVNGKIRAQEVIVETAGWSDYVFADDYKLPSLADVEAHIKTNKHLPGVPSAQEVAEKGVSVGDMQALLLAKIEELTLHQIAQEKRIAAQDAKIEVQQAEITQLKAANP